MSAVGQQGPVALGRLARRASIALLDTLLPPSCMACGQAVAGGAAAARMGALCAACFSHWHFIGAPLCGCCGVPFAFEGEGGREGLCPGCRALRPAFARALGAVVYDEHSRPLLLALKHGGRTELAGLFAPLMARAGVALLADGPLIVPVPLHTRRLRARGYNQAALLAAGIARHAGLHHVPDALRRLRATAPLGQEGAAARRAILAGAIEVRGRHAAAIPGRHVVVVDDVMTSGATMGACAAALLAAGAARVDGLVAARVPHPELVGSLPPAAHRASAEGGASGTRRRPIAGRDGDDA